MRAVVDIGNSFAKVGFFVKNDKEPFETACCTTPKSLDRLLSPKPLTNLVYCSVAKPKAWDETLRQYKGLQLTLESKPLPLEVKYQPITGLGADRMAASLGATTYYPNQDLLVVDFGTCITYTLVLGARSVAGGTITAGWHIRAQAMALYTHRIEAMTLKTEEVPLVGHSTRQGVQAGLLHGIRSEVAGMVKAYQKKHPTLRVVYCGGGADFFVPNQKKAKFVRPHLVLVGLNAWIEYIQGRQ